MHRQEEEGGQKICFRLVQPTPVGSVSEQQLLGIAAEIGHHGLFKVVAIVPDADDQNEYCGGIRVPASLAARTEALLLAQGFNMVEEEVP